MVDVQTLIAFAINGVVLGAILALSAIGLTLVYGILNLSNFAHGDYLVLGAYLAFLFNVTLAFSTSLVWAIVLGGVLLALVALDMFVLRKLDRTERIVIAGAAAILLVVAGTTYMGRGSGLPELLTSPFTLAAVLSLVLVPVFSIAMDYLLWRPLRKKRATVLTFIIVSIGLALALRHLLAMYFGTGLHNYDRPIKPPVFFGDYRLTQVQVTTVVVAALLIILVHVILRYTRVGKALRALADNPDLARVSGIDVDRMILYVWVISGALAAVAGILLAMNVNVNPNLGWNFLLPTFAAVILGGIGSAYGAMAGAMVIGVAMEVSVAWIPEYRMAVGFVILIAVLLVRPQGILGGKIA